MRCSRSCAIRTRARALGEAGQAFVEPYRREVVVPELVSLLERVATVSSRTRHSELRPGRGRTPAAPSARQGVGDRTAAAGVPPLISPGSSGDAIPASWSSRCSRRAVSLVAPVSASTGRPSASASKSFEGSAMSPPVPGALMTTAISAASTRSTACSGDTGGSTVTGTSVRVRRRRVSRVDHAEELQANLPSKFRLSSATSSGSAVRSP